MPSSDKEYFSLIVKLVTGFSVKDFPFRRARLAASGDGYPI
jgi:hypothetical protein